MGRLRIKKKDTVIPFTQTMFARLLLLAGATVFLVYTLWDLIVTLQRNNTFEFIVAVLLAVGATILWFFALDRLNSARVSPHMTKRMRRR